MGSLVLWATPSSVPPNGYHHGCSAGGSPRSSPILFGAAEVYHWNGPGPYLQQPKISFLVHGGVVAVPSQAVK